MEANRTLDARGLRCPMPIIRTRKEIDAGPAGEILRILATDPGSVLDFQGWIKSSASYELLAQEETMDEQGRRIFVHFLRRKR